MRSNDRLHIAPMLVTLLPQRKINVFPSVLCRRRWRNDDSSSKGDFLKGSTDRRPGVSMLVNLILQSNFNALPSVLCRRSKEFRLKGSLMGWLHLFFRRGTKESRLKGNLMIGWMDLFFRRGTKESRLKGNLMIGWMDLLQVVAMLVTLLSQINIDVFFFFLMQIHLTRTLLFLVNFIADEFPYLVYILFCIYYLQQS